MLYHTFLVFAAVMIEDLSRSDTNLEEVSMDPPSKGKLISFSFLNSFSF